VDSLRGHLLVAGPSLQDPSFRHTVVLVADHGDDGAMGVVLNRNSPVAVRDAVPPMAPLVDPGATVYLGGPVQPQAVVVLADFADPGRAGGLVLETVGFLPGTVEDPDELGGLNAVRVFAGYAGWAPGQLEHEILANGWLTVQADVDLIFNLPPEARYAAAMSALGVNAANLSEEAGHA
jgi:putative transcriptional regulator